MEIDRDISHYAIGDEVVVFWEFFEDHKNAKVMEDLVSFFQIGVVYAKTSNTVCVFFPQEVCGEGTNEYDPKEDMMAPTGNHYEMMEDLVRNCETLSHTEFCQRYHL